MVRLACLVAVASCAAPPPVPRAPAAPTLHDLDWIAGSWRAPERGLEERWQNVAGALYGVVLSDGGFEVNIIDDTDEDGGPAPITLWSIENGDDPMRFALTSATPAAIRFEDPVHGVVQVTRTAAAWRGELIAPGKPPIAMDLQPMAPAAAPVLEDADRAFAADTARDGADGWARAFAADGAMWNGARIEGPAIRATIAKTFARGVLRWAPVASGVRGDVGFTLGTFSFAPAAGGKGGHGSYCTIWRRQADGAWKVVFDTGRPGD